MTITASTSNAAVTAFTNPPLSLVAEMNEETRNRYNKDTKLGEGTYANVYLGHNTVTNVQVAIKKIKITPVADGITFDAIREIKYLAELRHPNIILLHSVFCGRKQNLNLVLEYLGGGDLEMIIKAHNTITYTAGDTKSWMAMALRGLWWCHKNHVLHRDIKPNNLLISQFGDLKLADFGLARSFSDPLRAMTHAVITRWYRPPELLFCSRYYGSAVDVWSLGLVFMELLLRTPWLAGNSDVEQMDKIAQAVGTPTEANWPDVTTLPGYRVIGNNPEVTEQHFYQYIGLQGTPGNVDLARSMLRLDPRKRISARTALDHHYFTEAPPPTKPDRLPRKGGVQGMEKMGKDLKRRPGLDDSRDTSDLENVGGKAARKLFVKS